MIVQPLLKKINKDFIKQYITKCCGLKDVKTFIKPNNLCFEDPFKYPHIGEAIDRMNKAIINKEKIGIVMDSDVDGMCSAALTYLFCKNLGVADIPVFHHMGKQHGIDDLLSLIKTSNINLLIIPDAGTNNTNECHELASLGIDIIILDHHEISKENPYAIIVNHHFGEGLNTALSGTGVVHKFCCAYYEKYEHVKMNDSPIFGADFVALSLISDVCDLSSLENRAYMYAGITAPTNEFIQLLFDKCCRNHIVNPHTIGFGIAPLGNALARADEPESKMLFFNGLVGNGDYNEILKGLRRVKRIQDNEVKAVYEELEPKIDYNQKTIIGFGQPEDKNYLGLIANKFCGKENKPTFLLRELNPTTWTGSMRSPIPLASKINESGLAKAQGHEEACGVTVKKSDLENFKKWLNELDLNERPPIPITACAKPSIFSNEFNKKIAENRTIWGKGIPEPTFYIKTQISAQNINIYQKNTTTIKLVLGNLSCIKFFAGESMVNDFLQAQKDGIVDIELIITNCDINEWEGNITPQCEIVEYEIHKIENQDNSLEDLW